MCTPTRICWVCRTCSSSFSFLCLNYLSVFCGRFTLHVFFYLHDGHVWCVDNVFLFFCFCYLAGSMLDQGSAGAGERTALHDRSIGRREQRRHQSTDVHVCHGHVQLGGHQQPTAEALQRLLSSRCKLSIFQCCQPPRPHTQTRITTRFNPGAILKQKKTFFWVYLMWQIIRKKVLKEEWRSTANSWVIEK